MKLINPIDENRAGLIALLAKVCLTYDVRQLEQEHQEAINILFNLCKTVKINEFGDYCITHEFQDIYEIMEMFLAKCNKQLKKGE